MPARSESREQRQQAILEILRRRPIARQTELVELLRERGIAATQSSVSRDLRQLGISKLNTGYVEPHEQDAVPPEPDRMLLAGFVRAVRTAGPNLTVVQTATGAAQRVAVYLDRSEWPEIVGTVSGDDTIFVATRNAGEQRRLLTKLRARMGPV